MIITIILNEGPYGSERSYNALRYATSLVAGSDNSVHIFLLGDGVSCGLSNQKTHEGFYNIAHMLDILLKKGVEINACGTCLGARGISDDRLVEGIVRSSLGQLVDWTLESDKVINF